MTNELHGSCLCGGVRYVVTGALRSVRNCHCTMCRKSHGSAFRTRASVAASDFRWLSGEELVSRYQSSPGTFRTFCGSCGSNLVTTFSRHPDWLGLALGTLDDDPDVVAEMHVFTGSKAPWHPITDSLPRFQEWPPERW